LLRIEQREFKSLWEVRERKRERHTIQILKWFMLCPQDGCPLLIPGLQYSPVCVSLWNLLSFSLPGGIGMIHATTEPVIMCVTVFEHGGGSLKCPVVDRERGGVGCGGRIALVG
jgi:hypothetical protein